MQIYNFYLHKLLPHTDKFDDFDSKNVQVNSVLFLYLNEQLQQSVKGVLSESATIKYICIRVNGVEFI